MKKELLFMLVLVFVGLYLVNTIVAATFDFKWVVLYWWTASIVSTILFAYSFYRNYSKIKKEFLNLIR